MTSHAAEESSYSQVQLQTERTTLLAGKILYGTDDPLIASSLAFNINSAYFIA